MRRPRLSPGLAADLFAVSNVAFLGLDIALAHHANDFARPAEWWPVYWSAIATALLLPGLLGERWRRRTRVLAFAAAAGCVGIGILGMIFHLRSGFFEEVTLHRLVYAAPFAAPLAYVGVGLLIVLQRLETPGGEEWNLWVLVLALGGFIGNFALCLTDHAQNAFFSSWEWTGVAGAALAVGFLAVAIVRPRDRAFQRVALLVAGLQILVGIAGFLLHWRGILHKPGPSLEYRVTFGPPAFAPLLFADLAFLAAIGLWGRLRAAPQA